ncbi:MAG: hypothetical protein V9F00_06500 [Nocardioides sp.]
MNMLSSCALSLVLATTLAGCSGEQNGGDCRSQYITLASAETWKQLQDQLVGSVVEGQDVASVRTQARGPDVGAGDRPVIRVIDLLTMQGSRIVQADVYREDSQLTAGVWSQCID